MVAFIDANQIFADSLLLAVRTGTIERDLPSLHYNIKTLSPRRRFESPDNGCTQLWAVGTGWCRPRRW